VALLRVPESSRQRFSLHKARPHPLFPSLAPGRWLSRPLGELDPTRRARPVAPSAAPPRMPPKAPVILKNSSKFCGIIWDVASQAWRAKIKVKGKTWYLGIYKDEFAAARAYDAARWFIYGPKGTLNFTDVDYDALGPPRKPPVWLVQHLVQLVGWGLCARLGGGLTRAGVDGSKEWPASERGISDMDDRQPVICGKSVACHRCAF
jgi:hypothetical protein